MFKNKYTVIILIMTIVISLSIFNSINRKHQDSLLIFTAVSLSEPMLEIKSLFENKYGIKILLNINDEIYVIFKSENVKISYS